MYLMVENKGCCDVDALLLMGVSSSRSSTDNETIGKFGSGFKYGLAALMRNDINPIVFIGEVCVEFVSEPKQIKDASGKIAEYSAIVAFVDDVRRETGFVTELGACDWNSAAMGIREIVSNAIDSANLFHENPSITVAQSVSGIAGMTRVFLPMTPDVQRFFKELPQWFLHFSMRESVHGVILKNEIGSGFLYRRGVKVGTTSKPSMFDYCFNELELDESRNVHDYAALNAAGLAIAGAETGIKRQLLACKQDIWEHDIPGWSMHSPDWAKAFRQTFGEVAVMLRDTQFAENIKAKGFNVAVVRSNGFYDACLRAGVENHIAFLNKAEMSGLQVFEPSEEIKRGFVAVWQHLISIGMISDGDKKPGLKGFTKAINSGVRQMGIYDNGVVFINEELGGVDLISTIVEELAHHITKTGDLSVDMQDFLTRCVARSMKS